MISGGTPYIQKILSSNYNLHDDRDILRKDSDWRFEDSFLDWLKTLEATTTSTFFS